MIQLKNLIHGELVAPLEGEYLDNFQPSNGQVYSQVPNSSVSDIQRAVESSKQAFKKWSREPVQARVDLMMKLADLIERDAEKLVVAESRDQGKPEWLARQVDIPRASANLRFFAHVVMNQKSISLSIF